MTGARSTSNEALHIEWRSRWLYHLVLCRSETDSKGTGQLFLGPSASRKASEYPLTTGKAWKKKNETSKQQHDCQ
jgi:hypothetical protein